MRIVLGVYGRAGDAPGSQSTREDYCRFVRNVLLRYGEIRDVVIWNEANSPSFWRQQRNAAAEYAALLARCWDYLHRMRDDINVISSTAPHQDPGTFLARVGAAYRASGRLVPLMDAFAFHPYGENSQTPPDFAHPLGTSVGLADYAKLVRVLGESFDGTAQRGSTLPIVYEEFGVESQIPKNKLGRYKGTEPKATRPVPEKTQAAYYKQAIQLAFCQPTIRALILFHVFDEPARLGWQSGLYYADSRPKASLPRVRRSIAESRRGVVDRCRGLALTPRVLKLKWPHGRITGTKPVKIALTCSIDCAYTARIEPASRGGKALATVRGRAVGKVPTTIVLKPKQPKDTKAKDTKAKDTKAKRASTRYRLRLSLVAPVNPGPPLTLTSPALTLG
jgi:hypothetical protein